jgi:UDP-N-acetylmuramoyl-tripeptide--D-alanyl-D-alanine ligase
MLSLLELRQALGRELLSERPGAARGFAGVTNDSRRAAPGEVFFALRTESRDGHDFIADACARGATGVVAEREAAVPEGVALFRVRDTKRALGEVARYWRSRFEVKCIAISGNVGKTTTKELTAALLARKGPVLRSPANFNDEVGLAMTVLQLTNRHRRAVLEVGMFELGEIRRLVEICRPEVAVVLNVGPTHLERLGSMEAIAAAKAEAVEGLPASGWAVLNADDPRVAAMAGLTRARVLTFGLGAGADVRGVEVRSRGLAGVDFSLRVLDRAVATHSPLPGAALVSNALAAAAVAIADGWSVEEAAAALPCLEPETRLRSRRARSGALVLDDTYNAGPASMLAALDVLAETPGRRIALLGDMLELGSEEAAGHALVGERAAAVADVLFTVGERGRLIAEAARREGATEVHHVASREAAVRQLAALLRPGDVLLVKASHGMRLETVVEELAR